MYRSKQLQLHCISAHLISGEITELVENYIKYTDVFLENPIKLVDQSYFDVKEHLNLDMLRLFDQWTNEANISTDDIMKSNNLMVKGNDLQNQRTNALISKGRKGVTKQVWDYMTTTMFGSYDWENPSMLYPQFGYVELSAGRYTLLPLPVLYASIKAMTDLKIVLIRPVTLFAN